MCSGKISINFGRVFMKDVIVAFTFAAGMLWVASDNMKGAEPKTPDRYEETQPNTPRLTH
jgi:hypothetical protein